MALPDSSALNSFSTLLYEEHDGVAWVTLNRPAVYNAMNQTMQTELRTVWRALRHRDEVRCVVITGAGDQAFSTGIDRTEQLGGEADSSGESLANERAHEHNIGFGSTPFHYDDLGDYVGPKANDLWKPVIAAVNGMACGGAFYLLGEVEFVIAADTATFFDPHVTYGMCATFEPIQMLQKLPFGEVMRMSLLGSHERLSAARAHQLGLVSEVVAPDSLREAAQWAAAAIASAPALAVQGTVRSLWAGRELSRSQALGMGWALVGLGTNDASLAEGQAAFSSGRRIDWRLR
jgi:enoyl-CoA hydratase/carnithine racemase